jgi:hypothetical protein
VLREDLIDYASSWTVQAIEMSAVTAPALCKHGPVPMPRRLVGAIAVGGLLILAAGCGSSSDKKSTAPKAPASAEQPPPALPSGDRVAFAELARSSGVLRAAAVPVAYGSASRIVVVPRLDAAASAVRKTRPRSAALRRLRARTLAALRLATSPGALRQPTSKRIASRAIAAADRIDAGLRGYAGSNPAANDLLPGSSG